MTFDRATMNNGATVLISNPNAGRGGAKRAQEVARFCEAMSARGKELDVLHTAAPGEATRLAASAVENGAKL